jgi:hypothetical protein
MNRASSRWLKKIKPKIKPKMKAIKEINLKFYELKKARISGQISNCTYYEKIVELKKIKARAYMSLSKVKDISLPDLKDLVSKCYHESGVHYIDEVRAYVVDADGISIGEFGYTWRYESGKRGVASPNGKATNPEVGDMIMIIHFDRCDNRPQLSERQYYKITSK